MRTGGLTADRFPSAGSLAGVLHACGSRHLALKATAGGAAWHTWDRALVNRDPAALERARAGLAREIRGVEFEQWLFFEQWANVRQQAHDRGELILGGALGAPIDGAILLFQGDSPEVAAKLARVDPYVLNGVVVRWHVRSWLTVVGDQASSGWMRPYSPLRRRYSTLIWFWFTLKKT